MPKRARSARPKQHSTPAAMIDYHCITPSMFPLGVPRALRTRRGDCVGWRWVPVPRCSDVRAHAFLVAAWRSSPSPCSSAFGPRRVQRPAFLASLQRRRSPRLRWLALPRISTSFWPRPSSSHAGVDPARPSRNPRMALVPLIFIPSSPALGARQSTTLPRVNPSLALRTCFSANSSSSLGTFFLSSSRHR